jgi:hypothetical protein
MAGSHISLIVMPIVIAGCLTFWIVLVYYASFHPGWKHHANPRRTDAAGGVFEATHGGRQLMPILGDPGEAIPQQREAVGAETYSAADAQATEQERAAATVGAEAGTRGGPGRSGATATGSRPPTESGPAGSGWPPE